MMLRWYPLLCKPGQNKSDYRGELEVRTWRQSYESRIVILLQVRVEFKINARYNCRLT